MASVSKKALDSISAELIALKAMQNEYKTEILTIKEILHRIDAKVSDLSCKVDMDISTLNITTTTKQPKKKPILEIPLKKAKVNIMSYFKLKFKESPESLKHIISEAEIKKLYLEHSDELKGKKKATLEGAKVALLYRELIKKNKEKNNLLRIMKEKEEEINNYLSLEPEMKEQSISDLNKDRNVEDVDVDVDDDDDEDENNEYEDDEDEYEEEYEEDEEDEE
jgi:hypothetical protein